MPKQDISDSLIPYFYKRAQTVLTGYQFDLDNDGIFETKYVANNENVSTYTALAVKRGTITSEDGTVLNEVEIGLDNADLAFKNYVLGGSLERKECKIYLLFVSSTGVLQGSVLLYWGMMDAPKGDENWVSVTVKPLPVLDREYPKRIYQLGCNWRFGESTTCGINADSYAYEGTISAASDGVTLTISHGQAVNYFVPGYVYLVNGDYAGSVRPILSNSTSSVTMRVAFDGPLINGTSVKVQKLCAKNPDACQNVFNNYSKYGGFPTVPKQPII